MRRSLFLATRGLAAGGEAEPPGPTVDALSCHRAEGDCTTAALRPLRRRVTLRVHANATPDGSDRRGRAGTRGRYQSRLVGEVLAIVVELQGSGQGSRVQVDDVIDRSAGGGIDGHRAKGQYELLAVHHHSPHDRPLCEPGTRDQGAEHPALKRKRSVAARQVFLDRKLVMHCAIEPGEAGFHRFVATVVLVALTGLVLVGIG